MLAGLGAMVMLASNSGGGGVDLFTEDLATEGVDPGAFIDSEAQAIDSSDAAEGIPDALPLIDDEVAVPRTAGETATPETDAEAGPGTEQQDGGTASPASNFPTALNDQEAAAATPAEGTTTTGGTTATTGGTTQANTTAAATSPQAPAQANTIQANPAQANTNQAAAAETDATPPAAAPVAVPDGPWCQVEVRQGDGVIRWDDDGRTTVFRRNDTWFHTPDEAAQAVLIPEAVNTNDDYVMRLWGGGTTDVACTFVSSADAHPAAAAPASPTPAEQEVATVANLPAPIAVPGGPVQMGFAADLWAQDRVNYWNDLEAVPGNGRLIAHEFKSFTKDINTDLYRWHQESGRDLLLTWNGTDAESILNGSHDEWIREHARELRSLPDTVMLRFWHEPDVSHKRAWIDNDPQQFIDSWLYVRQIFVEENALNVEWVWCPTAWNWNEQGARYYPGDANVDWICSDGYTGWDLDEPLTDVADAYTSFQAWADQRPNKPILIAEFGAGERGPGDRAEWVRSIPEWVSDSPNIRAVVYFDVDRRPHGEIYDWRLRTEPDAWDAMMDVLSSAPFGR